MTQNAEAALAAALEACLDAMAGGATRAECLAAFPEHAEALAPLLAAAARLGPLSGLTLPEEARARGRAAVRSAAVPPVVRAPAVRAPAVQAPAGPEPSPVQGSK